MERGFRLIFAPHRGQTVRSMPVILKNSSCHVHWESTCGVGASHWVDGGLRSRDRAFSSFVDTLVEAMRL